MKRILSIAVLATLVGCEKQTDMVLHTPAPQEPQAQETQVKENSRVEVSRIGVFPDTIAYGGRRGVYVIKDKYTGQEYIGISGVGISETGSHSSGKTRREDER